MKNKALSFDDILIAPNFSMIKSRKDVSTTVSFLGMTTKPIISSNMDSVTGPRMAKAMSENDYLASLHRFWSIEDNIKAYMECPQQTIVSFGVGELELDRALLLEQAGATNFLLDVAHGATLEVVKQVRAFREALGNDVKLIVGNFATKRSIEDFKYHLGPYKVDAWKVGIGGGSACLTRVVTGCGLPTLASIMDCASLPEPIIADGGIRNSGDYAKALAAGATCVMVGGLLAGTDESPGELFYQGLNSSKLYSPKESPELSDPNNWVGGKFNKLKKYRGSASAESYEVQGKTSEWRTAEGDSFLVPYVGPVKNVLQQLDAGLRSAMSYVGASNLKDFVEMTTFVEITNGGVTEGKAHGKGT